MTSLAPRRGATTDAAWIEIGQIADIPRQGARVVRTAAGDVAVFRTAGDEIFALADRCPHRGGPLSQGMVYGKRVACPLHDWSIELETGRAVLPDQGCARRYSVKIEAGTVFVSLSAHKCEGGE